MPMSGRRRCISYSLPAVIFLMMMMTAAICHALEPEAAPLSPAFTRYLQQTERQALSTRNAAGAHALGHIPAPVNFPGAADSGRQPAIRTAASLPAAFDLRKTGKLTAVRDQGSCGDCWAFATYGSLESYLMPLETWNFAEQDLNASHGFDVPPCEGGNTLMSTAYLGRWSGPLQEAASGGGPVKHVQKAFRIPRGAYPFAEIKQAILDHGAVTTSIYMNEFSPWYNSATAAYYYNGTAADNHDVAIVGWDDAYSRENFSIRPPADGAFILRNSWGTDFGEGGYFYMSYSDTYAGNNCWAFHDAEETDNYLEKYEYDPLGLVGSFGYRAETAWGANIFQAISSNALGAVAFWATADNLSYEIHIYTDVTAGQPTSGKPAASQSGSVTDAGYYTIKLAQPVALSAGHLFSVVVRFTTPQYNWPIPVELPLAGYSSRATAHAGESFFSPDGVAWEDVSASQKQINVCIKAFTAEECLSRWVRKHPATGALSQTELQDVNCIFDGVQALAPAYLDPPAQTLATDSLAYRIYSTSVACLAAWKSGDVNIFYLGPLSSYCPADLGTIESLKPLVCPGSP